jgi:hypothetical protein
MNGSESDLWFSKETTGSVCIVGHMQPRSTIRDMRKEILEKNPSNGWYQSAIHVTKLYIIEETEPKFLAIPHSVFSISSPVYIKIFPTDSGFRRNDGVTQGCQSGAAQT